ncbi:MAG: GspH/FimT family pseudopilin [Pseudomonadota bacterium]
MRCPKTIHAQAGFSLFELLLVAAIAGLLALSAMPSLSRWQANQRAHTTLVALADDIAHARRVSNSAASGLVLCPSANGDQCDRTRDYSGGWIVFRVADTSNTPTRDLREPVLSRGVPAAGVRLIANRTVFRFTNATRRSTNGTFTACDGAGRVVAKRLVVSYSGRARFATAADSSC